MVMFQARFFFVVLFFKPSFILDFLKALNQIVNALALTYVVQLCLFLLEYSKLVELEFNFFLQRETCLPTQGSEPLRVSSRPPDSPRWGKRVLCVFLLFIVWIHVMTLIDIFKDFLPCGPKISQLHSSLNFNCQFRGLWALVCVALSWRILSFSLDFGNLASEPNPTETSSVTWLLK